MILLAFILGGLVVIGTGSVALTRNIRESRRGSEKRPLVGVIATCVIGVVLAVGSFFLMYPYGHDTRIVGFPFPAAAWERHGAQWLDFVGPLMLPFMCGNAWFALVLPHLIFRLLRRRTG